MYFGTIFSINKPTDMKTKVLFLLTMLLTLSTVNAQRVNGARVGYIDMEYILENVDAYKEANTQLEAKAQRWKNEIQKKQNAIDQMKKNLSAERVLLTKELVDEREEEIEILSDLKNTMIQEKIQQGFAVRFFDPSNGKRFAAAYPNKKDAQDKAAQLKKDGLKDISITQHTLNFKEENNEII